MSTESKIRSSSLSFSIRSPHIIPLFIPAKWYSLKWTLPFGINPCFVHTYSLPNSAMLHRVAVKNIPRTKGFCPHPHLKHTSRVPKPSWFRCVILITCSDIYASIMNLGQEWLAEDLCFKQQRSIVWMLDASRPNLV